MPARGGRADRGEHLAIIEGPQQIEEQQGTLNDAGVRRDRPRVRRARDGCRGLRRVAEEGQAGMARPCEFSAT